MKDVSLKPGTPCAHLIGAVNFRKPLWRHHISQAERTSSQADTSTSSAWAYEHEFSYRTLPAIQLSPRAKPRVYTAS